MSVSVDAANDVYASFQIYLALARRAEGELDMRQFCADLGKLPAAAPSTATTSTRIPPAVGMGGPRPSELRALEKFVAGMTTDAIALERWDQDGDRPVRPAHITVEIFRLTR